MSGTKTSGRAVTELFRLSKRSNNGTNEPGRAGWKTAIGQMIYKASLPENSNNEERRYRFVFRGLEFREAIMYVKQPDGIWKSMDSLTASSFASKEGDSGIDIYRHIASDIKNYFNKHFRIETGERLSEIILPHLVGTQGAVNEKGEHLEVVRANPAVLLTPSYDSIRIDSNVRLDDKEYLKNSVSISDNTITIVYADAKQQGVLLPLLKIKSFPLEAAADLVELSKQVSGVIDVAAQPLEKLLSQPPITGTGKILVRIAPYKTKGQNSYEMTASAVPGGDLSQRFTPGAGPKHFITGTKEHKTIVNRDFTAELDNYSRLSSVIHGLSGRSSTNETPENLLKLLEFVHDHPDDYAVEWPKGEEIKFKGSVNKDTWHLFVETGTQQEWFKVEGNPLSGLQVTTLELLQAAQQSSEGEYIQLGEGEYIRMTAALRRQLAALAAIGQFQGEEFFVPKYFVGDLAEIMRKGQVGVTGDSSYNDLLQKIQDAYASVPEVPAGLNGTLRDYQVAGFQWMSRLSAWGAGACLADDMGLGKTVQTIAFMLSKAQDGPSLVIAPTTVVANWKNEIGRFAPSLNPIILNNESDRDKAIDSAKEGDVLLASYGLLSNNGDGLSGREWNVICLDEAHQIKNRFTKASQAAMSLIGKSRLILTGTPVQNNVSELWNLMQFINPGLLGTYKAFSEKFAGLSSRKDELREKTMDQLRSMTQPFILRRTKDEVVRDIPVKTEFDYMVNLTESEMAAYENERVQMEFFYDTVPPQDRMKFFFGDLGKLRRMACSMQMAKQEWTQEASKITELRYLLNGIAGNDNRIILFSQYTEFLAYVKSLLESMGMEYLYMDGSTPMGQRESIISDFQSGKTPVFVCSLKAGGIGINLTAANYVILLDPWWNPAVEQQAMDRAYRIGQTRDVTVIRMISYHTIEEKVIRLQEEKRTLSDDILEGTSKTASLSYEDIKEMLSSF